MRHGFPKPGMLSKRALAGGGLAGVVALALAAYVWQPGDPVSDALTNLDALRNLPPNRWVVYDRGGTDGWTRQGHAGMAFDAARGVLVVFGSDTHGENFDNAIHEFQPLSRRWTTAYPPSDPSTYRVDDRGRPVAGGDRVRPWAMHTYDTVEYDPAQRGIIVASTTEHSRLPVPTGPIKDHPAWLYRPATGTWEMHANAGQPSPKFFGGGLAYDENRDVIIGYRHDIWELGPDRRQWQKVGAPGVHDMEFSLIFDPARNRAFVFGGYRGTCDVHAYRPGALPGSPGEWQLQRPRAGPCPLLKNSPAALDRNQGLFLVVANDRAAGRAGGEGAASFVYDPDAMEYRELTEAELPPVGMNYMMTWHKDLGVFLLVTGSWKDPVTVWALRLDRSQL